MVSWTKSRLETLRTGPPLTYRAFQERLSEKVSQTTYATSTVPEAFITGFVHPEKPALILRSVPVVIVALILIGFSVAAESAETSLQEVGTVGSQLHSNCSGIRNRRRADIRTRAANKDCDEIWQVQHEPLTWSRRNLGIYFAPVWLFFCLGSQYIVNHQEHSLLSSSIHWR